MTEQQWTDRRILSREPDNTMDHRDAAEGLVGYLNTPEALTFASMDAKHVIVALRALTHALLATDPTHVEVHSQPVQVEVHQPSSEPLEPVEGQGSVPVTWPGFAALCVLCATVVAVVWMLT